MPRFRLLCHRAKPRLTYLYPRKRFSYPFSCSGLPVYTGLILALSLFPSHLPKTLSWYGQLVTCLLMRRSKGGLFTDYRWIIWTIPQINRIYRVIGKRPPPIISPESYKESRSLNVTIVSRRLTNLNRNT